MKPKMSSSDRISLERLRDSVVRARRWHHAQIQKLDALWGGFPGEIASLPPSQRAIRLEIARRQIAKFITSVPPSVLSPDLDAASPAAAEPEAGGSPAT